MYNHGNKHTMAQINILPQELIVSICDWLCLTDIQHLRLANRKLAEASLKPYAQKAFARVSATCTTTGLERLELLSQHPDISKEVREVILFVTPRRIWGPISYNIWNPPIQEGGENQKYHPLSLPEFYGWMRKTLVSSLKEFPQLKAIIADNDDPELESDRDIRYEAMDVHTADNGVELNSNSARRFQRSYAYEVVFSVLPELERQCIQLTVVIHWFDSLDNGGFSSIPLHPDKMIAIPEVQREIFGVEDFCLIPILQRSLQKVELFGNARLFDRRWDILQLLSSCPLKSLHLDAFNLTWITLLALAPLAVTDPSDQKSICSETAPFPQLVDLKLSRSSFALDLSLFIKKHLSTLKTISLVQTYANSDGDVWANLLEPISQTSVLDKLHIERAWVIWARSTCKLPEHPVESATWVGNDHIRAKALAVLNNGQASRVPGEWYAGYLDLLSAS
jgi:hypothetical protein